MSTHDPRDPAAQHDQPERYGQYDQPAQYEQYDDAALEEEITRGTVHERPAPAGVGSTAAEPAAGPATGPEGIRTGSLVWGVIALVVALWSLSTTVLDWDIDPVLVMIGLATLGGLVLVAGGIVGATRKHTS